MESQITTKRTQQLLRIHLLLVLLWVVLALAGVQDLLLDKAVMDVENPIRVTLQVRVVRHHDHRDALLLVNPASHSHSIQIQQYVHHLDCGPAVQIARRLVQQQHFGVVGESASDGDALLLTATQL